MLKTPFKKKINFSIIVNGDDLVSMGCWVRGKEKAH